MPESSPAGWFPDPFGRHERRYWDGSTWTEHVTSRGLQGIDPPVETPPVPATPQTPADWYPDPFGRHERRYWDGRQWTEHVTSRGLQGVDPPVGQVVVPAVEQVVVPAVEHAVVPTASGPSKKVERQARRVGADGGQAGGGTLFTEPVLVVNQKAKLIGSTLGYAVYDQHGHQLGTFQEVRRDLTTLTRNSASGSPKLACSVWLLLSTTTSLRPVAVCRLARYA